jgi:hypothetical protein
LLVVHVIEIQFNFVTITTGLIFWLSVGLLIFSPSSRSLPQETVEAESSSPHLSAWVGLAGSLMIRGLLFNQGWLAAVMMLGVIWLAARTYTREVSGSLLLILVLWLFGILGAYLSSAESAAAWDIAWVLLGLVLMGYRLPIAGRSWWLGLRISLLVITLWWWGRDIAAYIHVKQAQTSDAVHHDQIAVSYNGWDVFLRIGLSGAAFSQSTANRGDSERNALNLAIINLSTALELKPYDAYLAWKLADLEAQSGDFTSASFYYAAAVRMWPINTDLQAEWDRFRQLERFGSPGN